MQVLALDAITLDLDLQPRAAIDEDTWKDYAEALAAGVVFPPVIVFFDGATDWLTDGYHRWHAHKAIGATEIAADVRQGSKQEALRFSLSANATHGKRRGQADYRKAYDIACRNDLAPAYDAAAVQDLLQCSLRWAQELTRDARDRRAQDQAAAIAAAKAAGKPTRMIAADLGVDHSTVVRSGGAKTKPSFVHHAPPRHDSASASLTPPPAAGDAHHSFLAPRSFPAPADLPEAANNVPAPAASPEPDNRLPGLAAIDRPGVRNWSMALEAMRAINDLPPVDEMFAQPDWLQQQSIDEEVFRAAAWLNTFSARFAHDRPAR